VGRQSQGGCPVLRGRLRTGGWQSMGLVCCCSAPSFIRSSACSPWTVLRQRSCAAGRSIAKAGGVHPIMRQGDLALCSPPSPSVHPGLWNVWPVAGLLCGSGGGVLGWAAWIEFFAWQRRDAAPNRAFPSPAARARGTHGGYQPGTETTHARPHRVCQSPTKEGGASVQWITSTKAQPLPFAVRLKASRPTRTAAPRWNHSGPRARPNGTCPLRLRYERRRPACRRLLACSRPGSECFLFPRPRVPRDRHPHHQVFTTSW